VIARSALLVVALLWATGSPAWAAGHDADGKLDAALRARAHASAGTSRVIVRTADGEPADGLIRQLGGRPGRYLRTLDGQVALVADRRLHDLAASPRVAAVSLDRPVRGTLERTGAAIGAAFAREQFDLDGRGIGVAIIDSGVTSWHDDLGTDRVAHFVDFVDYLPLAYDDYGHGTHVAGIIAGSGYDSNGARRGIAPGASLVVLKVLDAAGDGFISNVIAALDYAIEQRSRYNIRVINLSVAAGVYESYETDPLTLAARRAVDAGIVVVTAAGNFGRGARGQALYGGITAPGNAPWVLTVGASSHNGTVKRGDDSVAPFSSRGPTHIDRATKPDLVAPGVGIESLADNGSLLFDLHPGARLRGTIDTASPPYLALSGTSMAAPVVAGTIALMLQANPALTPNLVKAILQYTAEDHARVNHFAEGAGFLNARGAVQLAKRLAEPDAALAADPTPWSRQILWGNHRITGGEIVAGANAWAPGVMWGAGTTPDGAPVVWGTSETTGREEVAWGAACADDACASMAWPAADLTALWGAACDADECETVVWGATVRDDEAWDTPCGPTNPGCLGTVWPAAPADQRRRWELPPVIVVLR
jgi:serine protease AprX